MWQKCPICEGTGVSVSSASYGSFKCTTCDGKKVISTLTGLPPGDIDEEPSKISFYETFKDSRLFKQKDLSECSKELDVDINQIVNDNFNNLI